MPLQSAVVRLASSRHLEFVFIRTQASHGPEESWPDLKQPRPQGFSLKKWVGREKALASAGHVYSLNIPEKLIYMQPAGFALTEVERSNNGK